jgi:hypothetical protein
MPGTGSSVTVAAGRAAASSRVIWDLLHGGRRHQSGGAGFTAHSATGARKLVPRHPPCGRVRSPSAGPLLAGALGDACAATECRSVVRMSAQQISGRALAWPGPQARAPASERWARRAPGHDAEAHCPGRSTGREHILCNVQVTPSSSAPGTGASCPQQRRLRKSGSRLHFRRRVVLDNPPLNLMGPNSFQTERSSRRSRTTTE